MTLTQAKHLLLLGIALTTSCALYSMDGFGSGLRRGFLLTNNGGQAQPPQPPSPSQADQAEERESERELLHALTNNPNFANVIYMVHHLPGNERPKETLKLLDPHGIISDNHKAEDARHLYDVAKGYKQEVRNLRFINTVLENNGPLNFLDADDKLSPLAVASRDGHEGLVQRLLYNGADPKLAFQGPVQGSLPVTGYTALHCACIPSVRGTINQATKLRIIKLLVNADKLRQKNGQLMIAADLNKKTYDPSGKCGPTVPSNVLELARFYKYEEIAKYLDSLAQQPSTVHNSVSGAVVTVPQTTGLRALVSAYPRYTISGIVLGTAGAWLLFRHYSQTHPS